MEVVSLRHHAERFNLLLLRDNEQYFEDCRVQCWLPRSATQAGPGDSASSAGTAGSEDGASETTAACAAESVRAERVSMSVGGELKLCSESLFFVPDDREAPILRLALSDVSFCDRPCGMSYKGDRQREERRSDPFASDPTVFEVHVGVFTEIFPPKVAERSFRAVAGDAVLRFRVTDASVTADEVDILNFLYRLNELIDISCLHTTNPNKEKKLNRFLDAHQRRHPFPTNILSDGDTPMVELMAWRVWPMCANAVRVVVTSRFLYIQALNNLGENSVVSWPLDDIVCIFRRAYRLRSTAAELFLASKRRPVFLAFHSEGERDSLLYVLEGRMMPKITDIDAAAARWEQRGYIMRVDHAVLLQEPDMRVVTDRWREGHLSNLDYLLYLNIRAGRSFNDLSRYPVMPWTVMDFTSESLDLSAPAALRDLSRPIGALDPGCLAQLRERLAHLQLDGAVAQGAGGAEAPPFLYGTHYSTPMYVLYYLIREFPEYLLRFEVGGFDLPDRVFDSLAATCDSVLHNPADLKELIPEFYASDGSFLVNSHGLRFGTKQSGKPVGDVSLPPWCSSSPEGFVNEMRGALESDSVSKQLHAWIDLVFGYALRGEAALRHFNVFYHLTYTEDIDVESIADPVERAAVEAQCREFGQAPTQLFDEPHPRRLPRVSREEYAAERARYLSELLSAHEHTLDEYAQRSLAVMRLPFSLHIDAAVPQSPSAAPGAASAGEGGRHVSGDGRTIAALLADPQLSRAWISGAPASGKTLLLRKIVYVAALNALQNPDAMVPFAVSVPELARYDDFSIDGLLDDDGYMAPMRRRFLRAAFHARRLLLVVDDLDTLPQPRRVAAERHIARRASLDYARMIVAARTPPRFIPQAAIIRVLPLTRPAQDDVALHVLGARDGAALAALLDAAKLRGLAQLPLCLSVLLVRAVPSARRFARASYALRDEDEPRIARAWLGRGGSGDRGATSRHAASGGEKVWEARASRAAAASDPGAAAAEAAALPPLLPGERERLVAECVRELLVMHDERSLAAAGPAGDGGAERAQMLEIVRSSACSTLLERLGAHCASKHDGAFGDDLVKTLTETDASIGAAWGVLFDQCALFDWPCYRVSASSAAAAAEDIPYRFAWNGFALHLAGRAIAAAVDGSADASANARKSANAASTNAALHAIFAPMRGPVARAALSLLDDTTFAIAARRILGRDDHSAAGAAVVATELHSRASLALRARNPNLSADLASLVDLCSEVRSADRTARSLGHIAPRVRAVARAEAALLGISLAAPAAALSAVAVELAAPARVRAAALDALARLGTIALPPPAVRTAAFVLGNDDEPQRIRIAAVRVLAAAADGWRATTAAGTASDAETPPERDASANTSAAETAIAALGSLCGALDDWDAGVRDAAERALVRGDARLVRSAAAMDAASDDARVLVALAALAPPDPELVHIAAALARRTATGAAAKAQSTGVRVLGILAARSDDAQIARAAGAVLVSCIGEGGGACARDAATELLRVSHPDLELLAALAEVLGEARERALRRALADTIALLAARAGASGLLEEMAVLAHDGDAGMAVAALRRARAPPPPPSPPPLAPITAGAGWERSAGERGKRGEDAREDRGGSSAAQSSWPAVLALDGADAPTSAVARERRARVAAVFTPLQQHKDPLVRAEAAAARAALSGEFDDGGCAALVSVLREGMHDDTAPEDRAQRFLASLPARAAAVRAIGATARAQRTDTAPRSVAAPFAASPAAPRAAPGAQVRGSPAQNDTHSEHDAGEDASVSSTSCWDALAEALEQNVFLVPEHFLLNPLQRDTIAMGLMELQRECVHAVAAVAATSSTRANRALPTLLALTDPSDAHYEGLIRRDEHNPALSELLVQLRADSLLALAHVLREFPTLATDRVLGRLLDGTTSPDARVRDHAARALGAAQRWTPAVWEALLIRLADIADAVRASAREAIAMLGIPDEKLVSALASWLDNGDAGVRCRAARALAVVRSPSRVAVQLLARHAQATVDGDASVRYECARALRLVAPALSGQEAETVRSILAAAMSEMDATIRSEAAQGLVALGAASEKSVEVLLSVASGPSTPPRLRSRAVRALGRLRPMPASAFRALSALLDDERVGDEVEDVLLGTEISTDDDFAAFVELLADPKCGDIVFDPLDRFLCNRFDRDPEYTVPLETVKRIHAIATGKRTFRIEAAYLLREIRLRCRSLLD